MFLCSKFLIYFNSDTISVLPFDCLDNIKIKSIRFTNSFCFFERSVLWYQKHALFSYLIVTSFINPIYRRREENGTSLVIPGKLTHKASARYWAYAYENNLLGILDDTEDRDYDWGHDDFTYSSASLNVFRPFRLGVEGLWRPFGNWSYFKFGIGMAARNPYSGNAIIYPEGELSADFRILNILGFNFGAFYKNRVWTQKVGLTLNCHILEIDAFAGFRCADLSRSFNATGAAAGVSVKMGW